MVISSLNDSHFEAHVAETQTNYMGGGGGAPLLK